MDQNEIKKTYHSRHANFSGQLANLKQEINVISNLRLVSIILMAVALYYTLTTPMVALSIVVAALLAAFLYLVAKHARMFRRKTHLENLVQINHSEVSALSGDWTSSDPGETFIDPHHSYTHDLDIFGKGSLFQYLNRATTLTGKSRIAIRLKEGLSSSEKIYSVQEAVKDLAPRIDFRQNFQAGGMEVDEKPTDMQQLREWLTHPSFIPTSKAFAVVLVVVPIATIVALALAFAMPIFKVVLFPLVLLQWILAGIYLKRINVFHEYISRKKNIVMKYAELLLYLENEKFNSPLLIEISGMANEAHAHVRRLASLVSALDARTNAMMTFFVNSLLLYDLQCVFRLEKWKMHHRDKLPQWLDAIADVEVLNSFATLRYNHPGFCFPTITEDLAVAAKGLAHPLIDSGERVSNDFAIGNAPAVHIVTGANMAGKSTFLRTLGVNLVLALNGAPVCAESFSCPIIRLRTGMRTADSLQDHQSYFFAELNRLKEIMDELRQGRPLMILLDEILKGTNSNDKQAGSIALVKQLLPHPCLAVIATHDLALGELEKEYPNQVSNYCFEATIENDQLSFDYRLKKGIATKMNASFLMKKMGIIP